MLLKERIYQRRLSIGIHAIKDIATKSLSNKLPSIGFSLPLSQKALSIFHCHQRLSPPHTGQKQIRDHQDRQLESSS